MKLILLVEDGLRKPGGLQGDLDYITFERNAVEKSYSKILQMIQDLMPKVKAVLSEEADVRAIPKENLEEKEEKEDVWQGPKEDWNRSDYEHAYMRQVYLENQDNVKIINDAYLSTDEGKISDNQGSWEAFAEYWRIAFGKGGKLSVIEEIEKRLPNNAEVKRYLAMGFDQYQEYSKAAEYYKLSADKASLEEKQLSMHGGAAVAYARAGMLDEAKPVLQTMRKLSVSRGVSGEEFVVKTLREIASIIDDDDLLFGSCERLLELHPDDVDVRFSLAYKYSHSGNDELALIHYLKIPECERFGNAWNNLGVEFERFKLNAKAVAAYRKSEEMGETLAMSNMANKLINAGFLAEADEICNKAVKIENYHKNIGGVISQIKEIPETEDKKIIEIKKDSEKMGRFYRVYGRALAMNWVDDCKGVWVGPDCDLAIIIKGDLFVAEGRYSRESVFNALSGLGGYADHKSPPDIVNYRVRYEGEIIGRTVKGTVSREKEDVTAPPASLLGGAENKNMLLMILSDDMNEINVFEKNVKTDKGMYDFIRAEIK